MNGRKGQPWYQANRQQKLGLVRRNRKKISQIINAYLYLPFFLLTILWKYYMFFLLIILWKYYTNQTFQQLLVRFRNALGAARRAGGPEDGAAIPRAGLPAAIRNLQPGGQ
jgi:hypothetical protein